MMDILRQTVLCTGILALASVGVAQRVDPILENVTVQFHVLKADLAEDSFGKVDITTADLEDAVKESGLKGAFNLIKNEGPVEVIYTGESSFTGLGANFYLGQSTPLSTTLDTGNGTASTSSIKVQSSLSARFTNVQHESADDKSFFSLEMDLDLAQLTDDMYIENIRTSWNSTLSFSGDHDVEIGRFSRHTAEGMMELIIIAEIEKAE